MMQIGLLFTSLIQGTIDHMLRGNLVLISIVFTGGGAGCAHVQFYQLSLEYLFIVVGDDSPERPLVHVCGWMGG